MNSKEKTGYRKFKEKSRDRALCRTRFGTRYGLAVIQTMEWTFSPGQSQFWKKEKRKKKRSLKREEMGSMVKHNNLRKYG